MRRRRLLEITAVAAPGLAGCLGRSPIDGDTATATTTPSATASPYEGPTVDGATRCPDRPDTWTRSTVKSFLVAFERAYLERSIRRRRDDVSDVSHDFGLSVAALERTADGYLATLQGGYAVYYGDGETAVHGDVFDYEARYAVDGARLRRTAATGEAADPREAGSRVYCPPRNPQPPPD